MLIVFNDNNYASILNEYFKSEYEIMQYDNIREAMDFSINNTIDIILCDFIIGNVTAMQFATVIKKYQKQTIIVCMKDCLESMLNDFRYSDKISEVYCKKTSLPLLSYRIENLFKLRDIDSEKINIQTNSGSNTVEILNGNLYVDGRIISLTPREFKLINLLIDYKNQALSRDIIIEKVWHDKEVNNRAVDVYIKNIRKKTNIDMIRTIRGKGYMVIESS